MLKEILQKLLYITIKKLYGHSTMSIKLYGKIAYFDFCKVCLYIDFDHCNSNEKLLSKNNKNLGNLKDFKIIS